MNALLAAVETVLHNMNRRILYYIVYRKEIDSKEKRTLDRLGGIEMFFEIKTQTRTQNVLLDITMSTYNESLINRHKMFFFTK